MTSAFVRLPYDVLREIILYTYVYTLEPTYAEAEVDLEVLSPPIPASQVCRTWRRVLLSDPTMWTSLIIPKMKNKWIMELLRRSESVLLNVFLDLDQPFVDSTNYGETCKMLSCLFQQINRFKILRVQISSGDSRCRISCRTITESLVEQVLSYLQRPAPKLQILSLWYDEFDPDDEDNVNLDYTIISTLFSGHAHNLKRIHHRLSPTFQELTCPTFYNLSELRLTLSFDMNFDPFLDLLSLSPNLKLLHVCVEWFCGLSVYGFKSTLDRKVSLLSLERLVLDLDRTVELADWVVCHVVLPSNLKWYITLQDFPDFEELSLPFLQFLYRAHFTSLHIRASTKLIKLISEEHPVGDYLDQFYANEFNYVHKEAENLMDLWDPLALATNLTNITHMVLEDLPEGSDTFPTLFASMTKLENLVIRQSSMYRTSTNAALGCLAALTPTTKDNSEYNPNITNLIQSSEIGPIGLEDIATHNPSIPLSGTILPVFPCPSLRAVTLELHDSVKKKHAEVLRACSDSRRKAGYPVQIHVHCPKITKGAKRVVRFQKNDFIKVSIVPIQVKDKPRPDSVL